MEQSRIYTVSKNELYGRYMVAKRNIKQGELILKENPILLCPQLGNPLVCFNCCAQLKKLDFCPDCSLAVLCNPKCIGRFHSIQECSAFKANACFRREDLLTNPEMVTPWRCLMWRYSNKDLFDALCALESHLEERRGSQIWSRIRVNVERVLEQLGYLQKDDLEAEVVQRVCGILDINTFDVRQPQRNRSGFGPGENLRGLYPRAALMAHCCVSNTHLAVDDDFVLQIHAAVDIPEGCPIFFNYTNALKGSEERRRQLQDSKHFQCKCCRCSDPTELQTEMSSLQCPRCHKGIVRPQPWQCCNCQWVYANSLIKMTTAECRRRIEEFENFDIETLEKFLKKLSVTFHPHHYLVLDLEQNLIRLYTQAVPTVKNLRRKIDLCHKLLEISRTVEPGISRIQAIAMYELHSALVGLAQKSFNNKDLNEEEYSKKLLEAEGNLKNSIKYLLYEPLNSPEGRLAQSALRELKTLRLAINHLQQNLLDKLEKKKRNKRK